MGEVYRAVDPRLEREVAIKVLPAALASSADRLRRFRDEALTASRLNHPNIVHIYDIGEGGNCEVSPNEGTSVPFVAMELVEGQTFETLLSGGARSWESLRPLARQVLEGLAAAHEAGIVHRDLKPANLMVTERGHVKILDFGLAKQFRLEEDQSSLGTLVGAPTVPGTALGTVGYMSPEQAKGVPADHRSDQFSFGVLLYEMATGECPFRRDTPAESVAALMTATPLSLEQRDTDLPEAICALVMRCLGKAPEERWATTGELLEEFRSRGADRSPVEHVASRGAPDRPSIAVLPFADMSADKDQEYFCDGMAEEIINALSQLGTVRVVARTSAFSFKGQDADLREVGHKLGVRAVLEGSVRKAGNRLRVTAQLINVEDGYHLWSERYDRELEDIFAVQDEISRAVVSELEVKLSPVEPLVPRRAASLEAYDLCAKGRHHFLHFTEHGHEAALRCFRASLDEDPSMAAAFAGIAMTCVTSAILGWGKAQHLIPKAKEAARRAISLCDRAFGAHYALAQAHQSFDWDWLGAEQEFRKELTGCPGNAEARAFFAFFLHGLGQNDAALREAQRAVDADPLSAMSHHMLANVLLGMGRIEEALVESELGVELGAGFTHAYYSLAAGLSLSGRHSEALATLRTAQGLAPSDHHTLALLGWASGRSGSTHEAMRCIDELEERCEGFAGYLVAMIYVGLGDHDQAFRWLHRGVDEREGFMCYLPSFVVWQPLRGDSRYGDVLRRMSFPDSTRP